MSQLKAHRFADVDFLKTICPKRLSTLLLPHQAFFAPLGAPVDGLESDEALSGLATVFLEKNAELPGDLVDALCAIREMATPSGMDLLIKELRTRNLSLPSLDQDLAPADMATEVWLHHPAVFDHLHGLHLVTRIRSVSVSQGRTRSVSFRRPNENVLSEMAKALQQRLEQTGRGDMCRVQAFEEDGNWRFLVRRGDPTRREGCLPKEGKVSSSIVYRPEVHEVLIIDLYRNELQHTLTLKSVREAYLEIFGEFLFGDAGYFTWGDKFTLEPLRRDGERSLACGDIPGMEEICLTELHYEADEGEPVVYMRRAEDLFRAYQRKSEEIPAGVRLRKAKFRVKFADQKKPRIVCLQPPGKASFTRDGDSHLIEEWMRRRGFLKEHREAMGGHVVSA